MLEAVVLFLGVSLWLYCLLAGADLGAGILEIFKGPKFREEQENHITRAMGPVWEANHIWIILAVVIFFNGFPAAFAEIFTVFHIPLTALLIGIVLRGTSFTFRHYDAIRDRSYDYYSLTFAASSLWTTFWLGNIVGAIILGRISASPTHYTQAYIEPWFNPFSALVGLFLCALFAFLAAVYLIGEEKNKELVNLFIKRALVAGGSAVLIGGAILLLIHLEDLKLAQTFFRNPWSLAAFAVATAILIPQGISIQRARTREGKNWARVLGGAQITLIVGGFFAAQYPVIVNFGLSPGAPSLTFQNSVAPPSTLRLLLVALVFGIFTVIPAFFYLLKIFKKESFVKV